MDKNTTREEIVSALKALAWDGKGQLMPTCEYWCFEPDGKGGYLLRDYSGNQAADITAGDMQ